MTIIKTGDIEKRLITESNFNRNSMEIDVDNKVKTPTAKLGPRIALPGDDPDAFRCIELTAKQIGAKFGDEEILPGISYPAGLKLASVALRNLCEKLLKASQRLAETEAEIRSEDVIEAIRTCDEFSIFRDVRIEAND